MSSTRVSRIIDAPIGEVFHAVADIDNLSNANPYIVKIEFLSAQKAGAGTRYRESRIVDGRRTETTFEVLEYIEAERLRLVADQRGALWDVTLEVSEVGLQTELVLFMETRPYTLMGRLVTPLISRTVRRAVEADMDAVKAHCER